MYQAKAEGGGFRVFRPEYTAQALQRLELEVHYQPQFSLDDRRVIGVEALLRWRHPKHGLVPPARFIPLAEESGLIVPTGTWVLQQACWQAASWRTRVAVNVSAIQFCRADFADAVAATGLPPSSSSSPRAPRCTTLRSRCASSSACRRWVCASPSTTSAPATPRSGCCAPCPSTPSRSTAPSSPACLALVRAILTLAEASGLEVVAEGVETAVQQDTLSQMGCHSAQGYALAMPMPAEKMGRILERATRTPRALCSPSRGTGRRVGQGSAAAFGVGRASRRVRPRSRRSLAKGGLKAKSPTPGVGDLYQMERETRLELATPTLARLC
ncbi:MAG: hypothetical protein C4333_12670, partial [Meiothermus sp.]